VQADEFLVDAVGRGAGGEPEHRALALAGAEVDQLGDLAGDGTARGVAAVVDEDGDFLKG